MGCGTPVITSNTTSLPEVCGDAAEYVDPRDAADIARAILKVYNDDALRTRMVSAGWLKLPGIDTTTSRR